MGCHTWFYKKITVSLKEAREQLVTNLEKGIEFYDEMIAGQLDEDLLDSYPEWTPEYGIYQKAIYNRKLRMVKKGLCSVAVMRNYSYNDTPVFYDKNKNCHYVSSEELPHNLFRIYGYPLDKLWSLNETLDFIEKNKEKSSIYDYTYEKLEEFWKNYPDGMIDFG